VLLNPTILLEVLSPSTEAFDRGEKFDRYRMAALLRDYVLVARSVDAGATTTGRHPTVTLTTGRRSRRPRSSLPPLRPPLPPRVYDASHFRTPQTTRRGEAHALPPPRGETRGSVAIIDLTPPMGPSMALKSNLNQEVPEVKHFVVNFYPNKNNGLLVSVTLHT